MTTISSMHMNKFRPCSLRHKASRCTKLRCSAVITTPKTNGSKGNKPVVETPPTSVTQLGLSMGELQQTALKQLSEIASNPFASQLLSHFKFVSPFPTNSVQQAAKVLQAASNQERALQQDTLPPNINKFLVPVDVWELKRIRKTSSLCSLTYGMASLTPRSLRKRHNLELLSTSWTCQLRQFEHSKTAEEVLAEGDGMSASITDRYLDSSSNASSQAQSALSKSASSYQANTARSRPPQLPPVIPSSHPPVVSPAEVLVAVAQAFPQAVGDAAATTAASSSSSSPSPESSPPLSPSQSSPQSATNPLELTIQALPQLALLVPPLILHWKSPGDIVASKLSDAAAAASAAAAAVSAAAAIPFNTAAETLYAGLSVWPLTTVPKPPGWPSNMISTAATLAAATAEGRELIGAGSSSDAAIRNGSSPGSAMVAVGSPGSSTSTLCPSEWFVCDDVSTTTRYFVVQGSDTFDHWRVNLTFDPVLFEDPAWNVKVHRGAYDAAKVLYDTFLPMVYEHLESSPFAQISFTGHSIGGSLATLLMLMFVSRGVLSQESLATVYTFGAPAVFCQGADESSSDTLQADTRLATTNNGSNGSSSSGPVPFSPLPDQTQLFSKLGLHNSIIRNIVMHRDIVPRAFTCDYSLVTDVLKGWGSSFRDQYGLNRHGRKHLYYVLGKMMVLQPDTCHPFTTPEGYLPMLPAGPELYALVTPSPLETVSSSRRTSENNRKAQQQQQQPQGREVRSLVEAVLELMDNPHPLAILGDRGAYMESGSISRYHNPDNYTKAFGRLIHLKRVKEQRLSDRSNPMSTRSAAKAFASRLKKLDDQDVTQWEGSDADDALLNPCFVSNVTPAEQHHC